MSAGAAIRQFVWLKDSVNVGKVGSSYVKVCLSEVVDVADLIAAVLKEFLPRWGQRAKDDILLYFVSATEEANTEPSVVQETTALATDPLKPTQSLAKAGITPGCFLLAKCTGAAVVADAGQVQGIELKALAAEIASLKALMEPKRVDKVEEMSKVSSRAFHDVQSRSKRLVLIKNVVDAESVDTLPCERFEWPHISEEKSTPALIDRLREVVQLTTIDELELVDARAGHLRYTFHGPATATERLRYVIKGHSDAAFVSRRSDVDINSALDLACALVDFKTGSAMRDGKQIQRQLALQALAFCARTGRAVTVVATDLQEHFRVWHLDKGVFTEYLRADKSGLTLPQGCGLLRKLLIQGADLLERLLEHPSQLLGRIDEDSEDDEDGDLGSGSIASERSADTGSAVGSGLRGASSERHGSGISHAGQEGAVGHRQRMGSCGSSGATSFFIEGDENDDQDWGAAIKRGLINVRLRPLVAANLQFLTGNYR